MGVSVSESAFWDLVVQIDRGYEKLGSLENTKTAVVTEDPIQIHSERARRDRSGYVYLLEGDGCYKIGHARDPENRVETLKIQLPYPVHLVTFVYSEDRRGLEAELHEKFADKRLNGEWFDLSQNDVEEIEKMGDKT